MISGGGGLSLKKHRSIPRYKQRKKDRGGSPFKPKFMKSSGAPELTDRFPDAKSALGSVSPELWDRAKARSEAQGDESAGTEGA